MLCCVARCVCSHAPGRRAERNGAEGRTSGRLRPATRAGCPMPRKRRAEQPHVGENSTTDSTRVRDSALFRTALLSVVSYVVQPRRGRSSV
eukprot:3738448-Alexandrium_andersonii.AAC.1